MSLVDIKHILILSNDDTVLEVLGGVSKRLGAHQITYCRRSRQALAELIGSSGPNLVIEDLKSVEETEFFPFLQEKELKNYLIPTPTFALITPSTKGDIERMEKSDYIGYESTPLNESLIEQKIREIYYQSYSYDQANALGEVVEKNIANQNLKLALVELLPALRVNPKNSTYLLLYATILFERKNMIRQKMS